MKSIVFGNEDTKLGGKYPLKIEISKNFCLVIVKNTARQLIGVFQLISILD